MNIEAISALSSTAESNQKQNRAGYRMGYVRRLAAIGTFSAFLTGGVAVEATPAQADSGLIYTVNNAEGGVYYRNSPDWNDTSRRPGVGIYNGDKVRLLCGQKGTPVGPYKNTSWHYVEDLSRPDQGKGWVSDHNTNTPNKPSEATPGEPSCDAQTVNKNKPPISSNPWDKPTRSVHDRIDRVDWADTAFGKSLRVYVTRAGYTTSFAFANDAFNEVMYDANMPYSGSLYNQFACHAYLAPPWKESWNLDTWRPDVGLEQTIRDECNPKPGEKG